MDLALNNQQRLIYNKNQPTDENKQLFKKLFDK